MAGVPWDLIESGALEPIADPREYATVRNTLDPYAALGLSPGASAAEVQAAYKALALEHHPDRAGDSERFAQILAARDVLVGQDAVLPFGCAHCPSRSREHAARKDVVRAIVVSHGGDGWVGWVTVDEKEVIATAGDTRWLVAAAPPDVALLSCAFLDERRRLAIGGTNGCLLVAELHGVDPTAPPTPMRVAIGLSGPVQAVAGPTDAHVASPLCFVSCDGALLVVDIDAGCVLRSVVTPSLQVEAIVCAQIAELDGDDWPPPPLLLVGGGDGRGGGGIACVRLGDVEAEDADAVVWRAEHDHPVYAVAAPPEPKLVACAAGSVVVLHGAADGSPLARLHAGRDGVLYALAFSPAADTLLAAGSAEVVHAFHIPAGTRRAVQRLTRSGWAGGLNTATINALAFVSAGGFVSGGYDACVTRWQLEAGAEAAEALELGALDDEELEAIAQRGGVGGGGGGGREALEARAATAIERLRRARRREMPAFGSE